MIIRYPVVPPAGVVTSDVYFFGPVPKRISQGHGLAKLTKRVKPNFRSIRLKRLSIPSQKEHLNSHEPDESRHNSKEKPKTELYKILKTPPSKNDGDMPEEIPRDKHPIDRQTFSELESALDFTPEMINDLQAMLKVLEAKNRLKAISGLAVSEDTLKEKSAGSEGKVEAISVEALSINQPQPTSPSTSGGSGGEGGLSGGSEQWSNTAGEGGGWSASNTLATLLNVSLAVLAGLTVLTLISRHWIPLVPSGGGGGGATAVWLQLKNIAHDPLVEILVTSQVLKFELLFALIIWVRYGLRPVMKYIHNHWIAKSSKDQRPFEQSRTAWLFRDIYGPLESFVILAAVCQLVSGVIVPRVLPWLAVEEWLTARLLAVALVATVARVMLNWQARLFAGLSFKAEVEGQKLKKHRVEVLSKIVSVTIVCIAIVVGMQSVGIEVQNLLAVGGLSGIALGLAGREIMLNVLSGGVIILTNPFMIGEEVSFCPAGESSRVGGIVVDIGWFRTKIKAISREEFTVPNQYIANNVVLNISRKQREWRILEQFSLCPDDPTKIRNIIKEFRWLLRHDNRVIQKLHRRVALESVHPEGRLVILLDFFVESVNKDQFVAIKEDLLLSFMTIVKRLGGHLAMPLRHVMTETTENFQDDVNSSSSPIMTHSIDIL